MVMSDDTSLPSNGSDDGSDDIKAAKSLRKTAADYRSSPDFANKMVAQGLERQAKWHEDKAAKKKLAKKPIDPKTVLPKRITK
jgi:hypothetical protein